MKLLLARHAQARSNVLSIEEMCPPDSLNGLTDIGRQEAYAFGDEIGGLLSEIPAVLSGTSPRARETGEIIANRFGGELILFSQLGEIFKVETPKRLADLHQWTSNFWRAYFQLEPALRTTLGPCREAAEVIGKLLSDFKPNAEVVVVSHGGKIELIVATLLAVGQIDRTIQFDLATGRYHLFDLTIRAGILEHCRVIKLNA
jgi:broad specificity phosphatase PhoE